MTDPIVDDPGGEESVTSETAIEESLSEALPTPADPSEKDTRDHLTAAALVHAASGIPMTRLRNVSDVKDVDRPRNLCDLKDNDDDLDKELSAVPPPLARQPAVPSQPGAFRAGGEDQPRRRRSREDSTVSTTIPAPAANLIEATLVEEALVPPPPIEAPIYKGEIVGDELEDEKIIVLSKKYVRYFAVAFVLVLLVSIVLAVALVWVGDDDDRPEGNTRTAGPSMFHNDTDDESMENSYWYLRESPQVIWEKLDSYTYITHHMAVVSIINPKLGMDGTSAEGEPMCTPLHYDFGNTSDHQFDVAAWRGTRRTLRHRTLFHEEPSDHVVLVSFTCGEGAIEGANPPDAMILVHNAEGESIAELTSNTTTVDDIHCQDATSPNGTVQYHQVLCFIPNAGAADGHYPFLFSCFSNRKDATVASVRTEAVSAACTIASNTTTTNAAVAAPAAVILSTQRLCRISDGSVLLEGSLLGEWNESSVTCPGQELESHALTGVPVCLSSSATWEATTNGTSVVQFGLPNVTILDRLSDDEEECSYPSLQESLILWTTATDYPRLQPLNETTFEQLEEYWMDQKLLVQQWLLMQSS